MKTKVLQIEGLTAEQLQDKFNELNKKLTELQTRLSKMPDDELLTRRQTAEYLGISLPTLWAWTNKGVIKAYRIGNKVRYKKADILKALQQMN